MKTVLESAAMDDFDIEAEGSDDWKLKTLGAISVVWCERTCSRSPNNAEGFIADGFARSMNGAERKVLKFSSIHGMCEVIELSTEEETDLDQAEWNVR